MGFDYYVNIIWGIISVLMLYYKQYQLIYPLGYFELEMVGIFLLLTVHYLRLYIGRKGNKCETSSTTVIFILLDILCALGNIYYIILQTYV